MSEHEPKYELIRSKRKTMSLQITRDARVVVRAPMRASQRSIADFVSSHQAWLKKHLAGIAAVNEIRQSFDFLDGQAVYFLGERLAIKSDDYISGVSVVENNLLISSKISPEARELAVIRFLSKQAAIFLEKRVESFAARMSVSPQAVTVTRAKTRWGSCSGKNRICFSYRLMCLPVNLIDYVVVHELAHIFEHNHSQRFYARLGQVLPDYKHRQAELTAFSKKLSF